MHQVFVLVTFLLLRKTLCAAVDFEQLTEKINSEAKTRENKNGSLAKAANNLLAASNVAVVNNNELPQLRQDVIVIRTTKETRVISANGTQNLELADDAETTNISLSDLMAGLNVDSLTQTTDAISTTASFSAHNILLANVNTTDWCANVECFHGARCSTDGTRAWCNCSWAFTGHKCQNALPLYLALGLIGSGIATAFFVGLSILLCIKLSSSNRKNKIDSSVDRTFNYIDTFNKIDAAAIYADPSNYCNSINRNTLLRRVNNDGSSPRPRLNLESFENDHNALRGSQTTERQLSSSNGSNVDSNNNNDNSHILHNGHYHHAAEKAAVEEGNVKDDMHAL